jgi:hypothetical protein
MMELVICADNIPVVDPREDFGHEEKETDVRSKTSRKGNSTTHGRLCGLIALRDEFEFVDRDISVCVSNQCGRRDAKSARVGAAQIQDSNAG